MIQITQTQENGYNVFKFEANNTQYDVLTTDNREYTVYSKRKGFSGMPQIKVYGSLEELAQRSKAFRAAAFLIATTLGVEHTTH